LSVEAIEGELPANVLHARVKLCYPLSFVGKIVSELINEVLSALGVRILVRVVIERDTVKSVLVHPHEANLIGNAKVVVILIKVLAFFQPAHIVDTCIENTPVTHECLEIAAILLVFFQHQYLVPFLGEDGGADEPAQATTDYDNIKRFTHAAVKIMICWLRLL